MTRWWNQYISIPFPDSLAVYVSATIHGQDERGRVMRRTVMRYVCLCLTMTFAMIAPRVKKRFPTLEHFVEAGLLQESEKESLEHLNKKFPSHSKQWLPIVWASSIVTRARKEGRIRDDFAVKTVLDELNEFRGRCGLLLGYDSISVPLVYTQVVTLAVYSYFLTTIMGHQWVHGKEYKVDLYFPVFTTLQFFFYMGWLKVAESLINPFGDDDDDFEVNWMIDRNLQVSYLIVDEMHHEHPELVRDQYWDEVFPQELPYTGAAEKFRDQQPQPSTANIAVKNVHKESETVPSSLKMDDVNSYGDEMHSIINFSARPQYGRSDSSKTSVGSSVTDAIPRNNSVVKLFKRFLSREDGVDNKDSKSDSKRGSAADLSNSTTNLKQQSAESKRKLAKEIIEEVDEQSTIQSNKDPARPSVIDFFQFPRPSDPVPVPAFRRSSVPMRQPTHRLSGTSAPGTRASRDSMDGISIGSEDDESWADEFTRLKKLREKERKSRMLQNIARSLSNTNEEQEMLLFEHKSEPPPTPQTPKDEKL
ncbi:bestrophin-4 isoform X2 [Agrilus planipennis]|uniref:Bestrophin homolog n=1 Tax=Agrilus planipennis TaxID=224129 RepID=A0A1W4XJ97_AGRPL|nr:bestrophin-4 isoform X2 [Agrilus planipennis]